MSDQTAEKAKIHQAMLRLGVGFYDALRIVVYDPDVSTACWQVNRATGHERIAVGPQVVRLDIPSIEMVLRHEFLHRATYNGFREAYADCQLRNVVEDICINRLLAESYPGEMAHLCTQLYPADSNGSIVSLANCTADSHSLPVELADLWDSIWRPNGDRGYRRINPTALYYRLMDLRALYPTQFSTDDAPGEDLTSLPTILSPIVRDAIESVLVAIARRSPYDSNALRMLNDFLNVTVRFDNTRLALFLRRLPIEGIDADSSNVLHYAENSSRLDMYPRLLSRRGMALLLSGLSESLGLYRNTRVLMRPRRLSLCVYVDISSSMEGHFGIVHEFVKSVIDLPMKLRVFCDELTEVTQGEFMSGNLSVGGGTDFDAVLSDLANDDEVSAGVMFTDGEGSVSSEARTNLSRSGKNLYIVHITTDSSDTLADSLSRVASDVLVLDRDSYRILR